MKITLVGENNLKVLEDRIDKKNHEKDVDRLVIELGGIGVKQARQEFANTQYQTHFSHPHDVKVQEFEFLGNGRGTITATGKDVLFIEFGAGVYNQDYGLDWKPYTSQPIVPHGEYGSGKGKQRSWGFYDEMSPTGLNVTTGNNPARAMYKAKTKILNSYKKTARKVLK